MCERACMYVLKCRSCQTGSACEWGEDEEEEGREGEEERGGRRGGVVGGRRGGHRR